MASQRTQGRIAMRYREATLYSTAMPRPEPGFSVPFLPGR